MARFATESAADRVRTRKPDGIVLQSDSDAHSVAISAIAIGNCCLSLSHCGQLAIEGASCIPKHDNSDRRSRTIAALSLLIFSHTPHHEGDNWSYLYCSPLIACNFRVYTYSLLASRLRCVWLCVSWGSNPHHDSVCLLVIPLSCH